MGRQTVVTLAGLLAVAGPAPAAGPGALELVQTIPLQGAAGRLDHLALDVTGQRLFIANLSNDSLDVVDLKAGRLVKQVPGQRKIQGVAYVPDLDRILVGNGTDGVCNAFDGRSYELLHSVRLADADNVRYDPRTKLIYVTHAGDAVSAIDPKTYAVTATVKLPGAPEALQLDPTRPRLYVNVVKPARVCVVDTQTNVVVATHPLTRADANYPLALDPAGGRVYVGCRKPPAVVALDAAAGKEVGGVTIPSDVDDLFLDAKRGRLYATCGEGVIAVIQRTAGDQFEVVEKIPTGKLARTGLFDATSGRLYVPVPRQEGTDHPELRVYQARP